MSLSNSSLPKPKNWQNFEEATWILFREILADPSTEMNGRQGQSQAGVDVYGRRENTLWVGVQCKKKMDGKEVTDGELRKEVDKAKTFEPTLSEFILISTAPRDAKIQKTARKITEELKTTPTPFTVSVWGWDQVEEHAWQHSKAWKAFDPTHSALVEDHHIAQMSQLSEIRKNVSDLSSLIKASPPLTSAPSGDLAADAESEQTELHTKINIFVSLTNKGQLDLAEGELNSLRKHSWASASDSERYSILIGLASIGLKRGNADEASILIDAAINECPKHRSADRNAALASLLDGNPEKSKKHALLALATKSDDVHAASTLIQAKSLLGERDFDEGIKVSILSEVNIVAAKIQALRNLGDQTWIDEAVSAYEKNNTDLLIQQTYGEAILEASINHTNGMIAGGGSIFPTYSQAEEAAELLFNSTKSPEIRFSSASVHNAALALRLVKRDEDAKSVLSLGLKKDPKSISLRMQRAIIAHDEKDFHTIIRLLRDDADHPEAISLYTAALAETECESEALDIIDGLDLSDWSEDQRAMVFSSELQARLRLQDKDGAISRSREMVTQHPNSIRFGVFDVTTNRIFGDIENARKTLSAILGLAKEDTPLFSILEIAHEASFLGDDKTVVDLLGERIATDHDSEALRLYLKALIQGQFFDIAAKVFGEIPNKIGKIPYFLRAAAVLAINTGDPKTGSKISNYLKIEPNDIEMVIAQIGFWQLKGQDKDIARKLKKLDILGSEAGPSQKIRLCHVEMQYGNKSKAINNGYRLLIENWNEPSVHLGYQGLILMYEELGEAMPTFNTIEVGTAFCIRGNEGERNWRIEEEESEGFSQDHLDPNSDFAKMAIGKSAGDTIDLSNAYQTNEQEIIWIKSVELDLLHRSMAEFNERFPTHTGMFKMSVDLDADQPFEKMIEVVKAGAERDLKTLDAYKEGNLPFSFVASLLGKDVIDSWLGIGQVGIAPRVCVGAKEERKFALETIEKNDKNGCVVDAITLAIIHRCNLLEAVTSVCGPIYVTLSTKQIFTNRKIESANNINKRTGYMSWNDGRVVMQEVTAEENKRVAEDRLKEFDWVNRNTQEIGALPSEDIGESNRRIIEVLDQGAADPALAAKSANCLLLSDDQIFREWASSAWNVKATWLQAVLLAAKREKTISIEIYSNYLANMAEADMQYASVDTASLLHIAKSAGYWPDQRLELLLSKLAAENGDIEINTDVVSAFLDGLLILDNRSLVERHRLASSVFHAFSKARPHSSWVLLEKIVDKCSQKPAVLYNHLISWWCGQAMGQANFDEIVNAVKQQS